VNIPIAVLPGREVSTLAEVTFFGVRYVIPVAPIASIGGAGAFDGIFVTGVLAVLYASVATHREVEHSLQGQR
jgi:uncharacterized membrane protein